MQCTGCRSELIDDVAVCLHCGTPVPREFATVGSVVMAVPDPALSSGDNWGRASVPPANPYSSLPPAPIPPPLPSFYSPETTYILARRSLRRRRRMALAAVVVVAALAVGSVGMFSYALAQGRLPGVTTGSGASLGQHPLSSAHATCAPTQPDPAAAADFRGIQLTSGLRNIDQKDYTPIDIASTFPVGNNVFITFTVGNIPTDGTISADWCLGGLKETRHRSLLISSNDVGVQGYFSLSDLDAAAVGAGKVVLWWSDATSTERVIAVQSFTVVTVAGSSR